MSKKTSKSPKQPKFAKDIFVSIENPGTDDEFQSVHKWPSDCASFEEGPKRVGRYVLKEVLKVSAKAEITVE